MPAAHADEETAFHLYREQTFILIRQIPSGMVMAYGDVAREIPIPIGDDAFVYESIRSSVSGYALKRFLREQPPHMPACGVRRRFVGFYNMNHGNCYRITL